MLLRNIFENLARTGEGKTAVIGWGRGMGHKGHMFLASSVITQAKETSADPYFVVSRTVGKDDPINPEEKLAIYKKVFPQSGNIFQTATEEMPDLTRVLTKLQSLGYTDVTIVVGADQVKALGYVKNYNGKPDKSGNIPFSFNTLNVISRQETNDPSKDQEGPRATPMRDVLMDPTKSEQQKFAVWRDSMNDELSDDEVRDLMHKAQQRMQALVKPKKGVAEGAPELLKAEMPMVRHIENELAAKGYKKGTEEYKKLFNQTLAYYRKFGFPDYRKGVAEDAQLPGDFKLMGQNLFLKNLAQNLKQRYPDATVKLLNDRVTAYHNKQDDEALSVMGTEVMDSGYIGVGLDDAFTESFQGVLVPTIKQTTEQLLAANPGTRPALFLSTDNWNPDAWTHIATKLGYRLVADDESLDEGINIGQEWMSDTELDQYVPDRLQQQWRELLGYDRNGNPSALWANLTGGYEPDVNDPQHRALMVKVANKWFAAKKIPNVKFFDVKDADDELEWLVQIGQQGVAEAGSTAQQAAIAIAKKKKNGVSETPIDGPNDNPMIYGHQGANPAELKTRIMRARGQLKDLSQRSDTDSLLGWESIARQFPELAMNIEQIRHAIEELAKKRKKGGIGSRGIDPNIGEEMMSANKFTKGPKNKLGSAAHLKAKDNHAQAGDFVGENWELAKADALSKLIESQVK